MQDVECILLSRLYKRDENNNIIIKNGREQYEIIEKRIPIISQDHVWKDEFYRANEQGLKPSLRLTVSTYNYDDEEEVRYMDKEYTIIRTDSTNKDRVILICQRKMKNV